MNSASQASRSALLRYGMGTGTFSLVLEDGLSSWESWREATGLTPLRLIVTVCGYPTGVRPPQGRMRRLRRRLPLPASCEAQAVPPRTFCRRDRQPPGGYHVLFDRAMGAYLPRPALSSRSATCGKWSVMNDNDKTAGDDVRRVLDRLQTYRVAENEMLTRARRSLLMSENELAALRFLTQQPDRAARPQALIRHLGVSSASVTTLIDKLERAGRVARRLVAGDSTMRWQKRSTTSTRPSSSGNADPGAPSSRSSSRPSNGCGGGTTSASTASSTCAPHSRSSRRTTLTKNQPNRHLPDKPHHRNESQADSQLGHYHRFDMRERAVVKLDHIIAECQARHVWAFLSCVPITACGARESPAWNHGARRLSVRRTHTDRPRC